MISDFIFDVDYQNGQFILSPCTTGEFFRLKEALFSDHIDFIDLSDCLFFGFTVDQLEHVVFSDCTLRFSSCFDLDFFASTLNLTDFCVFYASKKYILHIREVLPCA